MACHHYTDSAPSVRVSPIDGATALGILFEIENQTMQLRALGNGIDIIAESVFGSEPEASRSIMTLCDYLQKQVSAADANLAEARSLLGAPAPLSTT